MAIKPVTPETAARHEALYPRLATLLRQTEAGANKRPDAPVGAVARRLAEDLLFEARLFIGGSGAIPPAAPDLVGLATQLGQALVALDAYETRHAFWDEGRKCFAWSLPKGETLPIARLRPKTQRPPERQTARMKMMREKLARMIDAKNEQTYDRGRRDGALEAARAIADAENEAASQTYPRVQNLS